MDIYGMTKPIAGYFLMLIGIGFTISGPLAGYISDKVLKKRKPVMLIGLALSLLFWLLMAVYGNSFNSFEFYSCLFLLGFAFGFVNIYMTISKELFSTTICGTALACFNTFNFIGAGIFQFMMGFMLDSTFGGSRIFQSYQLIFILCVVGVCASIIFALISKETFGIDPEEPCKA